MKTLLVPIDFSDATQLVVDTAVRFATALGAGIELFHVVEPVASYVPIGASMDVLTSSPTADVRDTGLANKRLAALASSVEGRCPAVTTLAVVGLAVDEIVERAGNLGPEAIVVGSHGHGALYHLFSGSVVNGVLKRTSCPVLVIPVRSSE